MRTPPVRWLTLNILGFFLIACSGDWMRSCTSTVVGETVEAGKEVTKGVVEGIEDGRKQGASVDGATLVSSWAELEAVGSLVVFDLTAEGEGCLVTLAVVNDGEGPLRLTNLAISGLDVDGFVLTATSDAPSQVTVPAHAKDKVQVRFSVQPDRLGVVRIWGKDLPVR
jgi:hypothetical protein